MYVANDKSHGYNEKEPQYNIDQYGRFLPAEKRFPSSVRRKTLKYPAPTGDSDGV